MSQITFEDKEKLIDNPNIDEKNKLTADNVNEIKRVVNENGTLSYDSLPVGSVIDFEGTEIPEGYEEAEEDSYNIYSNEEQSVGILIINGKKRKIYRKTIYRPVLINGTEETINHGIADVDIMWCDPSHSFVIWPQPLDLVNNLPFLNSTGSNITLTDFTKTTFKLASPADRSALSGYITLLYLKTDDK